MHRECGHQADIVEATGLICLLVPEQKKHFLDDCDRKQQKQRLLTETTHAVVSMYSLLCGFVQQYSNNIDFMSTGESQMGVGQGANPRCETKAPLATRWSWH